ncbi:hypothetical protein [Acinetobacter sp. 1564232]|uniref:hypothetical protein n=1 Tax=Acinetobacter sp. 1564232 TaxID=1310723 RepID=UPI0005B4B6D1|nr:hypothetical protein [Acinetobacter sp. 1564232]
MGNDGWGLIFIYFNQFDISCFMKSVLEKTGFILLLVALVLFNKETPWPGYHAILPVFSTFLILLAENNRSFFTNNPIAQFLGNTSYSILMCAEKTGGFNLVN